jgi:SAM-dependent methyltransferase
VAATISASGGIVVSKYLPYFVFKRLWGDRKKFGIKSIEGDPDWQEWERTCISIYTDTQQKGIGDWVCSLAYPVVSRVESSNMTILEVGPGRIRHLQLLQGHPQKYVVCDIRESFLKTACQQLLNAGIPYERVALSRKNAKEYAWKLPFPDESFDIVISFYSLEHLYPLDGYLTEITRTLKRGGQIVGGIPCEGGLPWGIGRFLTTRRYVHKNYGINYDKIICWEHPNFADFIIDRLDVHFEREHLKFHPFSWLPMDFNLVASFVFKKP